MKAELIIPIDVLRGKLNNDGYQKSRKKLWKEVVKEMGL